MLRLDPEPVRSHMTLALPFWLREPERCQRAAEFSVGTVTMLQNKPSGDEMPHVRRVWDPAYGPLRLRTTPGVEGAQTTFSRLLSRKVRLHRQAQHRR